MLSLIHQLLSLPRNAMICIDIFWVTWWLFYEALLVVERLKLWVSELLRGKLLVDVKSWLRIDREVLDMVRVKAWYLKLCLWATIFSF